LLVRCRVGGEPPTAVRVDEPVEGPVSAVDLFDD